MEEPSAHKLPYLKGGPLMTIRCLTLYVYRSNVLGDCTNKGVSNRFNRLLVACPFGPDSFDADKGIPLNFCMVERKRVVGMETMHIVPATVDANGEVVKRPGWWMNGGNIAGGADSRFTQLTGHHYPLKIHDRREW